VIDRYRDRLQVRGLACGNNQELLAGQIRAWRPACAAVGSGDPGPELRAAAHDCGCELLRGADGLEEVARAGEGDIVVAALLGAAGLKPTLAAIEAGKTIALANKEVMVMAGDLVLNRARHRGATILPIDSEHNAIFQCLVGGRREELSRILLCASGGPFLQRTGDFAAITVEEALAHPRWKMGAKISIDSATLMNKGLEMIEAFWLFGLAPAQIGVVVHPQSIVHSLVEYQDGSLIAQLGRTDMAMPIQYCLSWPERWPNPDMRLDLPSVGSLEFFEPDRKKFRSLDLAAAALASGGTVPAALNAADEVAVAAFLNRSIPFPSIMQVVEETLARHEAAPADSLDSVFSADAHARIDAREIIGRLKRK
jgi:1-deoxy-D-xylulose-5-phosphate reductoisomerase